MDHELKPLIEELGVAINEALSESKDIPEVLAAIKRDGYDAFLALNATIVIQKREPEAGPPARTRGDGLKFKFSNEDVDFLRSMHISAKP